jgi:cytochrome c oxidase cbb3-type subunit IV
MELEKFFTDASSVFTVVSFLTFIGILWWTYSSRRSADFAEAEQLPFADEIQTSTTQAAENSHG